MQHPIPEGGQRAAAAQPSPSLFVALKSERQSMRILTPAALALAALTPVSAKAPTPANSSAPALVNEDVGVPVFPYDLTDRPYTVVGEVKAGVRKATVFSKSPSQEKIYRELWERAQKLGADAVINA